MVYKLELTALKEEYDNLYYNRIHNGTDFLFIWNSFL